MNQNEIERLMENQKLHRAGAGRKAQKALERAAIEEQRKVEAEIKASYHVEKVIEGFNMKQKYFFGNVEISKEEFERGLSLQRGEN